MGAPDDLTTAGTGRRSHVEREAKLEASARFELPRETTLTAGVRAGSVREEPLDTVYFDTPDLRLAKYDVSLRLRRGEGWTLKLPHGTQGQTLARSEHTFPVQDDAIPPDALDLVQALMRRERLVEVAWLQTLRRHVPLLDPAGRVLGEIADDTVSVVNDGRETASFREIEVELADDAPDEVLDSVVAELVRRGVVAAPVRSKLVRALGQRAVEIEEAPPAAPPRDAPLAGLLRSALAAAVHNLLRHDPGIRLGSDPEHVHQARVAARRLRSDLRAFRRFLDEAWVGSLREELKWLGQALGAVRDAEVLYERLSARTASLPEEDRPSAAELLRHSSEEHEHKRAELLIVLRSDRYLDLLDRLVDAIRQPAFAESAAHATPSRIVRLIRKPWRRLRAAAQSLSPQPKDAELHALRITAKRCRYTAEAIAPLAGRPARTFAAACGRLQDVLGEHQDAVVAQGWLRQAASRASSREAYAAGQVTTMVRQAAAKARAAWPRVWKRLDRRKRRRWMKRS